MILIEFSLLLGCFNKAQAHLSDNKKKTSNQIKIPGLKKQTSNKKKKKMKKGQKWQAASQHSLADTGDSYRHTHTHTHSCSMEVLQT